MTDPAARQRLEITASGRINRFKLALLDGTALEADYDKCVEGDWTDRYEGHTYTELMDEDAQERDDGEQESHSEDEGPKKDFFIERRLD